jgi:hypothetical protein
MTKTTHAALIVAASACALVISVAPAVHAQARASKRVLIDEAHHNLFC